MPSASQKPIHKLAPFPDLSPVNSPTSESKRKLDDGDEPSTPVRPKKILKTYASYEKHETHWYLDGNLMLQVGNTRFKVHRSRLASESKWFQALIDYWNGTAPDGCGIPEDVGPIADASDTIGDDPLFFLDAEEGKEVPGANELAALLTAMYRGIDYVFDLPTVDEIRLLYGAAYHYDVTRYETFAMKYMERIFPEFSKITQEPSLQNAVAGIHIGQKFKVPKIFSRALLDLARTSTLSLQDCLPQKAVEPPQIVAIGPGHGAAPPNGGASEAPAMIIEGPIAPTQEDNVEWEKSSKNILKDLSPSQFTHVLVLQRDLAKIWDHIANNVIYVSCAVVGCHSPTRPYTAFESISLAKAKYPCDPLLGIDELCRNIPHNAHYCSHMKTAMISRLAAKKTEICKQVEEHLPKW